jgi:hypothetical protein
MHVYKVNRMMLNTDLYIYFHNELAKRRDTHFKPPKVVPVVEIMTTNCFKS